MTKPAARIAGRTSPDSPPVALVPIALMIVDDSAIARAVLSRMLAQHKDFAIVALASNAGEALDALKAVKVDIVLLDVEMPGTTGLELLPHILALPQPPRVLVVSSLADDGAEAAVGALALGAADTLPKPGSGSFGGRFSEVLADRIRRVARASPARPGVSPAQVHLRAGGGGALSCLALGASTGGLHALTEFLKRLPDRIGAPILVTQHLPAVFMPFFARQIAAASGREARVAADGDALLPERILIAPGDAHLTLWRDGAQVRIRLDRRAAASRCLPSVDPMFAAVGKIYGPSGIGIVFSGMGRDGLAGSERLVAEGGTVLAQDQATSAVWGMPRAVAEAGLASAVLPPADLARRVASSIQAPAWR